MSKLEKANIYINNNKNKVNKNHRNKYHLMPPIGWMNDPNGFIYFQGYYHLFYQFYPYGAYHGPMHWGHARSKDLIKWETLPVALAPDEEYDKDGCFSGTAIEKDGNILLMYTGNIQGENYEQNRQVQCIATTKDNVHFNKLEQNPIIMENKLPYDAMPQDFRDPKLIERDGEYFSLIAARSTDNKGQILVYKSKDLIDWEFFSVLLKGEESQGTMWECPDLFEVDGKDVLLLSIVEEGIEYEEHSTVVMLGEMDWGKGVFHKETIQTLDNGFDFYAPQTILDDKNRRILISWMQMWGANIPTSDNEYGWAGSMTLPRELSVHNSHLYQEPVEDLKKYLTNNYTLNEVRLLNESKEISELSGEVCLLEFDINVEYGEYLEIECRSNQDDKTYLSYDCKSHLLELNREQSGYELNKKGKYQNKKSVHCKPINNLLRLKVYLDQSSIEVFINQGEHTLTSTIYPREKADKCKLYGRGNIIFEQLRKWDIEL